MPETEIQIENSVIQLRLKDSNLLFSGDDHKFLQGKTFRVVSKFKKKFQHYFTLDH